MVSTCMQGRVCGQLMLGTILPDPRGGVVVSTDLRLRHRVAFIIDELDALRDALIHLLILLLLVTRALRVTKLERSRHRVPAIA